MLRWGPEFSGQNSPLITALSQVRILPGPPRLIVAASTGRVRIAPDQGCQMHRVGIIPFDTRDSAVEILFVTSPTRRRWSLPKGPKKPGETHIENCRREGCVAAGVKACVLDELAMYVYVQSQYARGKRVVPAPT